MSVQLPRITETATTNAEGEATIPISDGLYVDEAVIEVASTDVDTKFLRWRASQGPVIRTEIATRLPVRRLTGRVVSSLREPIAGALLFEDQHDLRRQTDGEGRFQLHYVAWRGIEDSQLAVWAPGHEARTVDLPASETALGDIVLADGTLLNEVELVLGGVNTDPVGTELRVVRLPGEAIDDLDDRTEQFRAAWDRRRAWVYGLSIDAGSARAKLLLLPGVYVATARSQRAWGRTQFSVSASATSVPIQLEAGPRVRIEVSEDRHRERRHLGALRARIVEEDGAEQKVDLPIGGPVVVGGLTPGRVRLVVSSENGLEFDRSVELGSTGAQGGAGAGVVEVNVRIPRLMSGRADVRRDGAYVPGIGTLELMDDHGWTAAYPVHDGLARSTALLMEATRFRLTFQDRGAPGGSGVVSGSAVTGQLYSVEVTAE